MKLFPPRWTESQGWPQPSSTSHLSYSTISAPSQLLQAGRALLGPKPSPLQRELQGVKSRLAKTHREKWADVYGKGGGCGGKGAGEN